MASLPEKASLEPATAKVNSSVQRSIPVGPWSLASGLRARVRICAGAEGAGGLRAEWPQPGVPAAARAQQQPPPPPPLQPPPPPPPPPLPGPPPLPMAAPSLAAPGLSGSGRGRGRGGTGREDGAGGVGICGRGSAGVTPRLARRPGTRAAAAGGSGSSGPPGRDPLRRRRPGRALRRAGMKRFPARRGLGVSACHLLRAARLPQGHRAC